MDQKNTNELIFLNTANVIMLILITVIYLLDLFPLILTILCGVLWIIWLVYSNYSLIIREQNQLYQFEKQLQKILRQNKMKRFPNHQAFAIKTLTENHKAILAKEQFFAGRTERIQAAYQLIFEKSIQYMQSAVAFLEQYDFVKMPPGNHLLTLQKNSNSLVQKMQELSMNCFLIDDKASDVDISVIDDLLDVLKNMNEDD